MAVCRRARPLMCLLFVSAVRIAALYTGMVDVSQMSHDSIGTLLAAAAHYKEIILHTGPLAKMMGFIRHSFLMVLSVCFSIN